MGLIVKQTDTELLPQAVHIGVCYAIWDIGHHFEEHWGKTKHKLVVVWEIPKQRIMVERNGKEVDMPRATSQRYNLSLHKKANLRRDLENWRGRPFTPQELEGFEIKNLLGKACQLQILHEPGRDGGTYANISSILALPAGMETPKLENPTGFFSFQDYKLGEDLPANMPEWVQKLVQASTEWSDIAKGSQAQTAAAPAVQDGAPVDGQPVSTTNTTPEDDLPF